MMRTLRLGWLVPLLLGAAWAQAPVETATYLTGAWGTPNDPALLDLYRKAGFTLIGHNNAYADWAVQHGMAFIGSVGAQGLPASAAKPFEAHDGTRSMTVGLFTAINFNAPEVEAWWAGAVPDKARALRHPERVAFWKVHNEFGYHASKFWDYSPGSIARYQRWLAERYGTVAALNQAWGSRHASFEAVQPPRQVPTQDLPNWLEWRRFTSWNFADYFRTTGDMIRSVAPGARVSDNFYPTNPIQGWDVFELARQTDYLAYDLYAISRWDGLISGLDGGRSAGAAWNKPFLMMEYHAGPNQWIPVVRDQDLWIETNLGLAREMRALQWYMFRPGAGGREQGIHGILDSQGRATERLTAVTRTSERLQRLAPLLARSRQAPEVALLTSADNAYLAYATQGDSWRAQRQWDTLGRLLDDARIPHERIDPVWLAAHDPATKYGVILVANVPVLGDDHLARLRAFAEGGGTVIVQPDSATRDGLGRPRADAPWSGDTRRGTPWDVRGDRELEVQTVGRGRIVRLAWELPDRLGEPPLRRQRSRAYAAMLREQAGVLPRLELAGDDAPEALDAQHLRTPEADLVFLTVLGHQPRENVAVTVRAAEAAGDTAFVLDYRSAAVSRVPLTRAEGTVSFTVPRLDPAAIVLLPHGWQPLVGVDAPGRLVPGATAPVTVTVDNLGAETVGGEVRLEAPPVWTVAAAGPVKVDLLAPGQRAQVRFDVTVPADAAVDRFAVDHPLRASVTLDQGRTGTLTATAHPSVVPALDVALTYQDELLNRWQELTPAIMRWGWENELRTPPPPPVAVRAETPVAVTITADAALKGQTARLAMEPDGTVLPATVTLTGGEQAVPVTMTLPTSGEHRLVVTAGAARFEAPFAAGVNRETVAALLAQSVQPAGPYRLGVGARRAPARGTPVGFDVELGAEEVAQARVVDEAGREVPAAIGARRVTLAADVPADEARAYALVLDGRPREARAVRLEGSDDGNILRLLGRSYAVELDTVLGLVRSLQVGEGPVLAPYRTGVVATLADGVQWAPDAQAGATDFATSASPVQATVAFGRRLGPAGELQVTETWTLEAERIAIALRIANASANPISLARLDYELGIDPDAVPRWRVVHPDGAEEAGATPSSFAAQQGDLADWLDTAGRGLGLTLGRAALASKFQSGWQGVRHTPAATALGIMAGARLDPADYVLAEFELWPHAGALPASAAAVPETVAVTARL